LGTGHRVSYGDTLPGIDTIAIYLDETALVRVVIESFELELASFAL